MNRPKPAGESYLTKIEGLISADWIDKLCQVENQHEMGGDGLHAVKILTETLPDQPALYVLLKE